ncbi:Zinc metalloproteinase nas-7 [Orchesella cincta]|uniref:Metalloendopeptidase n=1 Tax=Orchesella cincta TaxID=48709 RepID=A0A1D2ME15_ORCCI|nr:Zinc metalloproteinase nas-7 [Orchesella cincta]
MLLSRNVTRKVTFKCHITICTLDLPKYITEDEFAAIRSQKIPIGNMTLPKYGEDSVPHAARPGFGPRLWINAQVPYTLDPSFSAEQRQKVALAIQAYHDATCIRFIPKQTLIASMIESQVDILHDPNVCGVAHLCMNTGAQFAKFGGSCVSPGVMIHELGHTLCMGHEQSRRDRDNWISFNTAVCQPHGIDGADFNRGLNKLYDYVSIEHYEGECYNGCFQPKQPGVTKCGSGGPLSVLDIEILNEMYGCTQGCLGYRYVNINNNPTYLVQIGEEPYGDILYSCRAYHQGDIIPGKYHAGRKECYVAYNGGEHSKTGAHIEVLTSPNGAKLVWVRSNQLPSNAIRGGRTNERETIKHFCQNLL